MSISFRHTAGFGKRIEYWVVGQMLKQGLDVYMPLVDDDAIDAVIKRPDGSFVEVQIKARSDTAQLGHGALFAAITHDARDNYFFLFYAERHNKMWILSSAEFIAESRQNKEGKNAGKRTLCLNGKRMNRQIGKSEEYIKERYLKYEAPDFRRLVDGALDPSDG